MSDQLKIPFLLHRISATVTNREVITYYGKRPYASVYDPRSQGLAEIPMLCFSNLKKALPPVVTPHRHPHLEICLLASGSRINYSAGEIHYLNEGDIWINKPGVAHGSGVCPNGPSAIYCIELSPPEPGQPYLGLDPEEAQRFWQAWLALEQTVCHVNAAFIERFAELIRIIEAPKTTPCHRARLRASVHAFIFATFEIFEAHPATVIHPGIRHALDFIETIPPEAVSPSLSALAREAGLSLPHFKTRFKQDVGIGPAKYLLFRRLNAAAERLATTDTGIVEISLNLGFVTSQHFANAFKAYAGETPTAYREACRREKQIPAVR